MVLQNLSEVLIIAYPLILIVLFLIARFIAGRSIKPISSIIETSNIITKDNLSSEFHYLKIEMSSMFCPKQLIIYLTESKTQSKEKEFTSDASHEDSVDDYKRNFRGFNWKPRNSSEYEKKLTFVFMK
jgi:hypothetical protein